MSTRNVRESMLELETRNSRKVKDSTMSIYQFTSSNKLPLVPNQQYNLEKDKILVYLENCNGHMMRRKMNFDSPRTKEAARQLGIRLEDCCMK